MAETAPSRTYVTLAVSFHIGTALAVTILNKAVLNTLPVPVLLLLCQSVMSIIFIHLGSILNFCSVPSLNWAFVRNLLPLLAMRIVAQLSKIFCLLVCPPFPLPTSRDSRQEAIVTDGAPMSQNVNASFYQIARGLLLPFTILLSLLFLRNSKPNFLALVACVIVTAGFLMGVSGEAVGQTSTTGIVWGVLSSLATAIETVIVKHFVSDSKSGILDLVYTTSMATIPVYALIVTFDGELLATSSLGLAHPVLRKFAKETIIAGIFNFLLSAAAYLQIRATSPIT